MGLESTCMPHREIVEQWKVVALFKLRFGKFFLSLAHGIVLSISRLQSLTKGNITKL